MFVFNDCRTDTRVRREAASLADAGHDVTIMARPSNPTAQVGDREMVGSVEIVRIPAPHAWRFYWTWLRYPWRMRRWWVDRVNRGLHRPPLGWLEVVALAGAGLVTLPWIAIRLPFFARARRRPGAFGGSTLDWVVLWRYVVLGWASRAATAAPKADAYHGHDLTGLQAAGRASRLHGGALVYDSHEIFLESGPNATRPRILKRILARSERSWAHLAAALVTVNRSLAVELGRRLNPARTVVVHNAPERWNPPVPRPDLIRAATGIPSDEPIALYHGGFSADRGLEELAAAVLQPGLERVHAVYLGYGSQRSMLDAMAADSRFGGRLHVLDAVPPDELASWVASADVGVMAIQSSTLNHRMSTPNKLFECLAAGLPVVASDFPEMREIIMADPAGPLGIVCRPDDPAEIARSIAAIVERPSEEREALRARCLEAAHARWNWESEVIGLLDLYTDLERAALSQDPAIGSDGQSFEPNVARGA
jgi:glycosyltransferase involved in cell wall biosynthesis